MLTLDQALTIVSTTLEHGAKLGLKPLTVAVLDSGGHLIALQRQDGASNLRPQIATAKASGALDLGVSSRTIAGMAIDRPSFVAALGPLATKGLVPAAGGLIIENSDGLVIGAVGVTGDTSDNDEECALAGLTAANLQSRR
jgi:uncharacterized protein GlcG (DUF336 family)